jgi:hypothetical protein
MSTDQQQLIAQWQSYFDEQLRDVGVRAPPSIAGQSPDNYVRETCRTLKRSYLPQNNEYYQVNYRGLRADALSTLVPQLVGEVKKQIKNPANLDPGEIRPIVTRDINGVERRDWVGQESFVRAMTRLGRRVVSFTTDRGKYDAIKARWF